MHSLARCRTRCQVADRWFTMQAPRDSIAAAVELVADSAMNPAIEQYKLDEVKESVGRRNNEMIADPVFMASECASAISEVIRASGVSQASTRGHLLLLTSPTQRASCGGCSSLRSCGNRAHDRQKCTWPASALRRSIVVTERAPRMQRRRGGGVHRRARAARALDWCAHRPRAPRRLPRPRARRSSAVSLACASCSLLRCSASSCGGHAGMPRALARVPRSSMVCVDATSPESGVPARLPALVPTQVPAHCSATRPATRRSQSPARRCPPRSRSRTTSSAACPRGPRCPRRPRRTSAAARASTTPRARRR
jgi:hypothetical protein